MDNTATPAKLKVLLCATGSVATIKVPQLVTHLTKGGCTCKVAVSRKANVFLETVKDALPSESACPVIVDDIQTTEDREQRSVELCDWADVLVFAPLSANSLSKLVLGLCDDLTSCVARCWDASLPMLVAPAMNTKMWNHPVTASHVEELKARGVRCIEPISKLLACGDRGVGAMAGVEAIVAAVEEASLQPCTEDVAAND